MALSNRGKIIATGVAVAVVAALSSHKLDMEDKDAARAKKKRDAAENA